MNVVVGFQAKNNGGLENEGSFSAPIEVDPSLSEFEIQGLKPQTSYIVLVRLINEAGAAEQKIRVKTTKEKAGLQRKYFCPSADKT